MSRTAGSVFRSVEGERTVMRLYDEIIQRWPVPYRERVVPTRHGETFVLVSGPAVADGIAQDAVGVTPAIPLILMHGSVSNALSWMGDVEQLTRSFTVYAVDQLGEPGRSARNRPRLDGQAPVEWMRDVVDGLGLDRVALAGISLGAWFSLRYATAHPEKVRGLVLIAPTGVARPRMVRMLAAVALSAFGRRGTRAGGKLMLGTGDLDEETMRVIGTISQNFHPRVEAPPLLSDQELRSLSMPVLVMGGANDGLIDMPATAKRMRSLVPDVTIRMVAGRGHALMGMAGEYGAFLKEKVGEERGR